MTDMLPDSLNIKALAAVGGLPAVFQSLTDQDRTGTLKIQKGDREAYIYFAGGKIRSVAYPHKRSILAEGLRRCDKISQETLDKIFAKQRDARTAKKSMLASLKESEFPEAQLKDSGFIVQICSNQIGEDVYDIWTWATDKGEFKSESEFMENKLPEGIFDQELLNLPIDMNPGALLMEGARREDEWVIIRKVLPSNKDVPYLVRTEEASLETLQKSMAKENEEYNRDAISELLSYVNGIRDFDEILELVRMPTFKAMKLYSKLAELKKIQLKNAEDLKQMANLDILQQNIFKCIRLYERVEELGLQNLQTIHWLARAYESSGLTSKAIDKYRELGTVAMEQHLYEDAVRAYNKVVEFAPDDLESYKKLINAYKMLPGAHQLRDKGAEVAALYARKVAVMDKRNAIAILDEANKNFRSTPNNVELMATLYQQMGEKENAISTYNTLANLMRKQKDLEKTLDAYHKILAIDPGNVEAHLAIAKGLIELGKIEDGVAQYKELGNLLVSYIHSDIMPQIIDEICTTLISLCETIIQYEPNNITAREWLVDTYVSRKDRSTALNILRNLLVLLQKEQNLPALVTNLRKIVDMDQEDFNSLKLLADTLLKAGDRTSAVQEYMQLGLRTYEKTDMRRAKEAFEAIIAIDPFNLVARQHRADILRHLNMHAKSVDEYRLVGYLCKALGRREEALQAFAAMVELTPEKELSGILEVARLCEILKSYRKSVSYYKVYANEQLKRGNFGEVYHACARIFSWDPNDVEVMKIKTDNEILKMKKIAEEKLLMLQKVLKMGK